MVWKRVLLVGLVMGLAFPTVGVSADEPAEPESLLDFTGQVYPFGTKVGGFYFSPGMHGLGVAYHIAFQHNGKSFSLCAEYPVNGLYPDFDMVAVDSGGFPIKVWNDLGCEGGPTETIPSGTKRLYVYMPLGPDPQEDPLKGTFRFIQP